MRLLHTTSMTFKEINFPFIFEYTHVIFVSFPGGTGKLWINQILLKLNVTQENYTSFPKSRHLSPYLTKVV